MANSVLCLQCGAWIYGRCDGVKKVTQQFKRNFTCRKYEGNIGDAVEQEEKLCDEVGIVTGNIGDAVEQEERLCDEVGIVTGNIGDAVEQEEILCNEVGIVTGNIRDAAEQEEKLCNEVETMGIHISW